MVYPQIFINSLATSCLLAPAAYGFILIFRGTRSFHFAQAGVYGCGVYAYIYGLEKLAGSPIIRQPLFLEFAIGITVSLAWLIEKTVYFPIYYTGIFKPKVLDCQVDEVSKFPLLGGVLLNAVTGFEFSFEKTPNLSNDTLFTRRYGSGHVAQERYPIDNLKRNLIN